MKIAILSDIHGNLSALKTVIDDMESKCRIDACILLGDLIDYGMHSNEVILELRRLSYPILCNIWGNHESAISNQNYTCFSSERGKESAKYTRSILTSESWDYIRNDMCNSGKYEFELGSKKCMAVHGSLVNEYWKSITCDENQKFYADYDYIFSGHSHIPHFFEKYIEVNCPKTRNKKKTIFINPGSVGQPRNINNHAQYAIFDTLTEEICMCKKAYNISKEQDVYNGQIDDFYRERIKLGV